MQQYSLFVDSPLNPSNTLLVREADGAMRPAQRAEILAVARELVSIDTLHGEDLSNPDKAKAFLQLRLAGLEHGVGALMLTDVELRLIERKSGGAGKRVAGRVGLGGRRHIKK